MDRAILSGAGALILGCAFVIGCHAVAQTTIATEVKIEAGNLKGKLIKTSSGESTRAFLGIPFAESTVGKARWRPPVPKRPWQGVFEATDFGDLCPQQGQPSGLKQSEDCLSINVWTPDNVTAKSRLPVMVYIHGGNFNSGGNGGTSFNLWDGAYLAANEGVIVVSANYRLGALGFLAVDELSGNFGFMDQILALEWVQENIAAFGGDPTKVTIFGESSGAMSVGFHLTSSARSQSLFRAAIMESNLLPIPAKNLHEARNHGSMFKALLGVTTVDEMRRRPVANIIDAQAAIEATSQQVFTELNNIKDWGPVVDGDVIARQQIQAFADGAISKPVLFGTNANEANLFVAQWGLLGPSGLTRQDFIAWATRIFGSNLQEVLTKYQPTDDPKKNPYILANLMTDYLGTSGTRFAAEAASKHGVTVYPYLFDHVPSFNFLCVESCKEKVCHVAELPFVFHTVNQILLCPPKETTGYEFTAVEKGFSKQIMAYWTQFAKTLTPGSGAKGAPVWPAFTTGTATYMHLNIQSRLAPAPDANYELWNKVGYLNQRPWVQHGT